MFLCTSLARLTLICSAALCLISCADEDPSAVANAVQGPMSEGPNAGEQSPALQESFGSNYFKATVLESPQPNSYELQLAWAPFGGTVRILDEDKVVGFFTGEQATLSLPVVGGQQVKLKIQAKRDAQKVAEEIGVFASIPTDFVITGAWTLKENLNLDVNRVFFLSGATVTTLNNNLSINAKSLIAESAVIRNFAPNSKASREMNGRHGGAISITAERAQGQVSVILTGEDGGDGRIGARGRILQENAPTCVGTSGGHGGNAGSLVVNLKNGGELNLSSEIVLSKGGLAGQKGRFMTGDPADYVIFPCDINAQEGVNGRSGSRGEVCLKRFADQSMVCSR